MVSSVYIFRITFTTHSGSLDDDPTSVASMVDEVGNVYLPTGWEGPGPGGHHREGMLVFNAIESTPKYIELRVNGIGGISERLFRWNLE